MAENIELGIFINLGGNVDKAGKQAAKSLEGVSDSVKALGNNTEISLGNLLALQSSLFVLTKLGAGMARFGFGITGGIISGFRSAINMSTEFQNSLELLRLLTGDSFEFAKKQVLELAANTNLSTKEVVDLSQRILSLGFSAQEVLAPLAGNTQSFVQNIAAGIARLSGMERSRALNAVANLVTDISSFERLLNTGVPRAAKEAFKAASTEAEKFAILAKVAEQNFSNIFGSDGILLNFGPASERAFQQVGELIATALLPVLDQLAPLMVGLAEQLKKLKNNQKFIDSLTQAFSGLVAITKIVIKFSSFLIDMFARFVTNFPTFTNIAVILIAITGVIIGLIGVVIIAVASIALFTLSWVKLMPYLHLAPILLAQINSNLLTFATSLIPLSIKKLIAMTGTLIQFNFALSSTLRKLMLLGFVVAGVVLIWDGLSSAFSRSTDNLRPFLKFLLTVLNVLSIIFATTVGIATTLLTGGNVFAGFAAAAATFAGTQRAISWAVPPSTATVRKEETPLNSFSRTGGAEIEGAKAETSSLDSRELASELANMMESRPINVQVDAVVDEGTLFSANKRLNRKEERRFSTEIRSRF